jgi:hypothetical protein
VRVPWIRAEGAYTETANPKRLPFNTPSRLGPVHPGLERPVCDPSLCPGTGLAQRDRSQSLPACEEASATNTLSQHHRRAGAPSSARIHTAVMCTIPQACDILRQPAGFAPLIDRERRVGCSMDSSCELLNSL